jgi:ribosome-associated protein
MQITDTLTLDEALFEERFIRASGPGGQSVNKTESAVQLRFDLRKCSELNAAQKKRLAALAGSRLSKDGILVLRADNERSQERNRAVARERLKAMISAALTPPKPRLKARASLASKLRQKAAKAKRGERKSLRQKPGRDDH